MNDDANETDETDGAGDDLLPMPQPAELLDSSADDLRRLRAVLEAGLRPGQTATAVRGIRHRLTEIDRILGAISALREGQVDLSPFLSPQPSPTQLAAPARRGISLARATRRMDRAAYRFPDPQLILGALGALLGADAENEIRELELRLLHFLAEGSLTRDGMLVSHSLRRLVAVGHLALTEGETKEKTRQVAEARFALLSFLENARGRR